jgi:chromosome segregation protein
LYLKSLELQGFKSFADKTKIELGSGIAAIVGPNGSGKSNVVEAIKWVLGEQSAKSLRGHKMQDVIFSGTKKRKPLGVAEISLVLDNSDRGLDLDFTEVRVTRRLYRSGDGEYLINGRNVRLKDIHQLFADSGIGSDGYAVIGQGRIAEILDSRPEERRAIVEETAGVVKYRERKKEALRKIERSEENLTRLTDIMSEIESRLGPLKRDAETAAKYLEFSGERDHLAIGMLGETIIDTRERLQSAEEAFARAEGEHKELAAEVMAGEARLDEERAALALRDDDYHQREQQFHALKLEIEKSEGELKTLETRILGCEEKKRILKEGVIREEQRRQAAAETFAAAEAEEKAARERLDALREDLRTMEDRRRSEAEDLLRAEAEMEELRAKAFEMTRQSAARKNERITLTERKTASRKRLEAIDEKFRRYDEEEAALNERLAEISDAVDDLAFESDRAAERCREAESEAAAASEAMRRRREEQVELKMRQNRGEARLKVLEELTLKREGFYPGVRAVLERKSAGADGIYGVIAELIRVDKEYSVAVESVLGGALQNIVTATGEDAAEAVAFLKKHRRGTATFLPLDLLQIRERRAVPKDILNHSGYRGNAADMVSAPQRVRPAVEYLLGNTLIFSDLSDAVALTRRHKGQFRIVTVEGDVINAGGTVTGGSREKSKNTFLQRQNEIAELRRLLLSAEKENEKILAAIGEEEDRRKRAEEAAAAASAKAEKLRRDIAAFEGEINTIDTRRELFERERETLTLEREQLEEDEKAIDEAVAAADRAIAEAAAGEQSLIDEIRRREDLFKTAKSSEDQGRDEHTTLQVSFAETKSVCEGLRLRLEEAKNELTEIDAAQAEKTAELAKAEEEAAAAETRRDELDRLVLGKNRELMEFTAALGGHKEERERSHAALDEAEQSLRAVRRAETEAKEKVYQLSLRTERLKIEADQCETQLREEYQMLLADAVPYIDREKTKKEKRERIKTLKQQIDALGNINVGAIEEYRTVSERFAFLTEQRDDVLDAKDSLERIVAEMDEIITKRFKETFDAINDSFQATFPAFFRGGHGELRLTDEEDLLASGVDIVVQPPGKRLQHLSLLSGGEKSLSGIALLFAILKVKPSPFYVLDEIDAALDDANVRRFADYLTRYGSDSQFMIITHRQGTMEAASTMYGVTMAEEGVSKTVSVRLA